MFKSSLFDFIGARDGDLRNAYGQAFVDSLIADRKTIFNIDTFRSLILVLVSGGVLWLFFKERLSKKLVLIAFAGLVLFDLVTVDLRYVNSKDFIAAKRVDEPYQPNAADKEILKDEGHFRVLDLSNEGRRAPARAAYFHNSLSGYHAAKLGRFDDLMDFHIYNNNMNVLNMLNTKYIIAEDQGQVFPYTNPDANGNAWFISQLDPVASANSEIKALDSLDTKRNAVMDMSIFTSENLKRTYSVDSTATISLVDYKPNHLIYTSLNANDGYAVFSELYYYKGWKVFIDGEEVSYQRVNYALRGLPIPKGEHTIEFKFQPDVIQVGSKISLASSLLFMALFLAGLFYTFKTNKTT